MKTDGGKGSETSSREAVAHVVVRRDVDGDQYISVAWTGKPPSNGTKLYATPQNSADIDAMRLGNEHLNALRFIATTTWPEESPVGKRLSEVIAAIDAALQAKGVAE